MARHAQDNQDKKQLQNVFPPQKEEACRKKKETQLLEEREERIQDKQGKEAQQNQHMCRQIRKEKEKRRNDI
jgi:hypothetical protein